MMLGKSSKMNPLDVLDKEDGLGPRPAFVTRRSFLKIGATAIIVPAMSGLSFAASCPSVPSPRQTRGPFFPYDHVVAYPIQENERNGLSLVESNDNDLTRIKGKTGSATGQIVYFYGQLLHPHSDEKIGGENCRPLVGAVVLLWQANFSGQYNHQLDQADHASFSHPKTGVMIERVHDDSFQYWGKAITDANGQFHFKTILPGFYPAADDWYRPPHLHFSIRAKGYPEFVTQTYFSGQDLPGIDIISDLNEKDLILHDSHMTSEHQKQVIVEYKKDPHGILTDGLVGSCKFLLVA